MLNLWQQCKLGYLRKNNQLEFDSMRRFGLPNEIIKHVLLDEISKEIDEIQCTP